MYLGWSGMWQILVMLRFDRFFILFGGPFPVEIGVFPVEKKAKNGLKMGKKAKKWPEMGKGGWCG